MLIEIDHDSYNSAISLCSIHVSHLTGGGADYSLTYRNARPVLRAYDQGGDRVLLAAAKTRSERFLSA